MFVKTLSLVFLFLFLLVIDFISVIEEKHGGKKKSDSESLIRCEGEGASRVQ